MDREKLNINVIYNMAYNAVSNVENCIFANKGYNYIDDDWIYENFSKYIMVFIDSIFELLYGVNSEYIDDGEEVELRKDLKEEEIAFYYFNFWNSLEKKNPIMINTDMWIELMGEGFNDINEYLYKYGVSKELKETYEWNEDELFDMSEEALKKFIGIYGHEAREKYIREEIVNL